MKKERSVTQILKRLLFKVMASLVLLFFLILSLPYLQTRHYNFPDPKPFQGDYWHNPYATLSPRDSIYKANFHAHTVAWEGVTNGHDTENDMYQGYKKEGYDIIGISNYHSIADFIKDSSDLFVPVYEHGYNLFKSHCLSINSNIVSFFDYPFWQSTSHQQQVINEIKYKDGIVAMAHPKFGGRTREGMSYLTNYELMEVVNQFRISDEYWDAALSGGKLVYAMGNDDVHNMEEETTFENYTHIYSDERSTKKILYNLTHGKSYAVKGDLGPFENYLEQLIVKNDTLFVNFSIYPTKIEFIGQNGVLKQLVRNGNKTFYALKPEDTYIRIVAHNVHSVVYYNPIIRYDGKTPPTNLGNTPTVNWTISWLLRFVYLLINSLWIYLLYKVWKR